MYFLLFLRTVCSQNQIIKCVLGQRRYMLHCNVKNLKQIGGEEMVAIYVCFFEACFLIFAFIRNGSVIHKTYNKITLAATEFCGELNRGVSVTRKTIGKTESTL